MVLCAFSAGPARSQLAADVLGAGMMLGVPRVPGGLQIPQETLYKKNVLLVRGRFRPFTLLHNDMLMGAPSSLASAPTCKGCHEPSGVHLLLHAHMCRMQESHLLAQRWQGLLGVALASCNPYVRKYCKTFVLGRAGAASQFFCGPGGSADGDAVSVTDSSEECVFREDTLVLLEMTTRDMMEARPLAVSSGRPLGCQQRCFAY